MTNWTLITNHAAVLLHIAKYPNATAQEIAAACGITERATRKIIADLDAEEYISKKKEGRRIHYTVHADAKMRHHILEDKEVGKFLELFGWQGELENEPVPVLTDPHAKMRPNYYETPDQRETILQNLYSQPL